MTQEQRDPIPYAWRLVASAVIGLLAAAIGTGVHRMGAATNMPYGLALALVLVTLSAMMARSIAGGIGLGLHVVASSLVLYAMSGYGPGGDIMMPTGGAALTTFFSLHATAIWMIGMVALQIVVLELPSSLMAKVFGESANTAAAKRASRSGNRGQKEIRP